MGAFLDVIEEAEECETAILIQMDAINLLCAWGLQLQGPALAGIAALGRVLEFLIQDATAIGNAGDVLLYQRAIGCCWSLFVVIGFYWLLFRGKIGHFFVPLSLFSPFSIRPRLPVTWYHPQPL